MSTVPPFRDVQRLITDPTYFIVGPMIDRETWISANLTTLNNPQTDRRQWLESLVANIETLVARAKDGQL